MKAARRYQVDLPSVGLSCRPCCSIKRMKFVNQPFVERICRVDVDAISGNDMIVLKTDAADARLARIGLQIEGHPFFQHDRSVFRSGTEVRRLPWVDARAVTQ